MVCAIWFDRLTFRWTSCEWSCQLLMKSIDTWSVHYWQQHATEAVEEWSFIRHFKSEQGIFFINKIYYHVLVAKRDITTLVLMKINTTRVRFQTFVFVCCALCYCKIQSSRVVDHVQVSPESLNRSGDRLITVNCAFTYVSFCPPPIVISRSSTIQQW